MTLVSTTTTQQDCKRRRSSLQIVASDQIFANSSGTNKDSSNHNATLDPIDSIKTGSVDLSEKTTEQTLIISPATLTQSILHGLCVSTLYLIHFMYMAYIAQKVLRINMNQRWETFLSSRQSLLIQSGKPSQGHDIFSLLKQDQARLTKTPNHLAITLSTEQLLERSESDWHNIVYDLCQATCWAWEMGIEELSVFDASGVLKHRTVEINKQQSMALHQWKQRYHSSELTQNDFKFTILSLEDAQAQLVNATQKSYHHLVKNAASSVDIDLVNGFMQETMSDPDLMIVYDGLPHHYISLDGYSPWHIRLTEFVNATSYHRLDYGLFISSLYKYSRVEQRFGQ